MRTKLLVRFAAGLVAVGASSLTAYVLLARPWHLKWGASEEETKRPMPLDDEVGSPDYITNRAVTINSTPEEIWPWLVQMGELPRGGFYSYVTVERLLGMEVENAKEILPQYQHLAVGDFLDRKGQMIVKAVEPERSLVLGPPKNVDMECTWATCLYPVDASHTRVVSRVRARLPRNAAGLAMFLILDPGQFIMERKWLLTLKERAERAYKQDEIFLEQKPMASIMRQ